jgi:protein-L-isoaspartate(D-aspartate) O-methyltransferase
MAKRSAPRLRRDLVAELHAKGVIRSDAVEAAFMTVPRERFVPEVAAERGLEAVYRDEAIVTKRDPRGMPLSSSSQPALMAEMLELLAARRGDRVLEIGTGTGYNAALLAHIVGPKGHVTSVDVDAALVRAARRALRETGYRASLNVGDGREGHHNAAPYDRIIVTACADEIPHAWFDQLADGGRLELPLRLDPDGAAIQLIPVFERQGNHLRSVALTWGGFMPLHAGDGGWRPPPATLGASRSVKGTHTSLISMSGAGLEQLPADAARDLLASMLTKQGPPVRQGLTDMSSTRPPLFLIYLLLRIPDAQRVSLMQDGRLGVGLTDRRSRSLAVISLRSPWRGNADIGKTRSRWRLDAYGNNTAAVLLDRLASEWQQLQRDHRTTLQVTARGQTGALRLSFAWVRT